MRKFVEVLLCNVNRNKVAVRIFFDFQIDLITDEQLERGIILYGYK